MPNATRADHRYVATRRDVWAAVGVPDPNPLSGPEDPDPFNVSLAPWTEFLIASRICELHQLPEPGGQVGRAIRRDLLKELLDEMVAEGSLVGRPRHEWAALGREPKSRASDILYAHPVLAKMWAEVDALRAELKRLRTS